MPESDDNGLKWWVRYVIVPLIGGGGLVSFFLATRDHQPSPATAPAPEYVAPRQAETATPPSPAKSIDFYLSNMTNAREEHTLYVWESEKLATVHWNVQRPGAKFELGWSTSDGKIHKRWVQAEGEMTIDVSDIGTFQLWQTKDELHSMLGIIRVGHRSWKNLLR